MERLQITAPGITAFLRGLTKKLGFANAFPISTINSSNKENYRLVSHVFLSCYIIKFLRW
jgi:hypothetical protein